MPPLEILIATLIVLVTLFGGTALRGRLQSRREQALRGKPFPSEWKAYLRRNVSLYDRLPEELQDELKGHIQVFLDGKQFEGCGGLEVTEEMRVTIAGLACILLLNRPARNYPGLKSILVYPAAYIAEAKRREGFVELADQRQVRLGESWDSGVVVLSWNDVSRSAHDVRDGHNLVFHEFAHQLDQEDGAADGVPVLEHRSSYLTWAQVFSKEYAQLRERTEKHQKTVMDAYGATNPAEFFAVATETFFEKPRQLHRKHPELYRELKEFYRLDPVAWR